MKTFIKDALLRALRTFCQTLVALIGADQVSIVDLDWLGMLSVAATAAVVSILTSIATGLPETNYAVALTADDDPLFYTVENYENYEEPEEGDDNDN